MPKLPSQKLSSSTILKLSVKTSWYSCQFNCKYVSEWSFKKYIFFFTCWLWKTPNLFMPHLQLCHCNCVINKRLPLVSLCFPSQRSTSFSEIYAENKKISVLSTEQASWNIDFLDFIPEVPICYVGLDTLSLVKFLSVPPDKSPRSRECPFYRFPVRGIFCRTGSLHPPTHPVTYVVPKGTVQETCCTLHKTSLNVT